MKLTEWIDNQPDYGICSPPMSSDQALDFLFDYLIPGNYDPIPESPKQVNTYIVHTILMQYSKKYQREVRERAKKYRKIKKGEKQ
jgi:hypothetical protein